MQPAGDGIRAGRPGRPDRLQLRLHGGHRALSRLRPCFLSRPRHLQDQRRTSPVRRGQLRRGQEHLSPEPEPATHPQPAGLDPARALPHGTQRRGTAIDLQRHPLPHDRSRQSHQRSHQYRPAPGLRRQRHARQLGLRSGAFTQPERRGRQVRRRVCVVRPVRRRRARRHDQSVRALLRRRPGPARFDHGQRRSTQIEGHHPGRRLQPDPFAGQPRRRRPRHRRRRRVPSRDPGLHALGPAGQQQHRRRSRQRCRCRILHRPRRHA